MAVYNKFQQFVADVMHGVHNLSANALHVALMSSANAPISTNSVLADLTEIDYTNLVGRTLVTSSEGQVAGVYRFIVDDFTLEAAGGAVGPFRYVALYNDSPVNKPLIAWYDIGQDITLAAGETLLLDFNNIDGVFNFQ